MANTRVIKKRIRSVKNTRKITRTMELVATAKAKRASDRIKGAQPYAEKLKSLMRSILPSLPGGVEHPLARRPAEVKKVALLVVTANRGLCGGYNANLLRLARETLARHRQEGIETELHALGKKGIAFFRFADIPMASRITHIDDRPTYGQAEELARGFADPFLAGEIDRVEVVYSRFLSSSRQEPALETLLPLALQGEESAEEAPKGMGFLWDAPPDRMLEKLVPLFLKTQMLRMLMESVASEQVARRIAMKNATDNADEMNRSLVRTYNRVRQAQITQQIAEIVGGAEALT